MRLREDETEAERAHRRATNSAWAARRRERLLAEKNFAAQRCQAVLGRGKPCGTPLESRFVDGETVPFCVTCDLKRRGICIDCKDAPVYGTKRRALRCEGCQRLEKRAACKRSRTRHPDRVREKWRTRMADPVRKQRNREYRKLARHATPKKAAEAKRRDYIKHRAHYLEYHRQYREARLEQRRATERARHRGELPPRHCVDCPAVVSGRMKRCESCRERVRRGARAEILARLQGHAS